MVCGSQDGLQAEVSTASASDAPEVRLPADAVCASPPISGASVSQDSFSPGAFLPSVCPAAS